MFRSRVLRVLVIGITLFLLSYSIKHYLDSQKPIPPVEVKKSAKKKCDTRITKFPVVIVANKRFEIAGVTIGMKLDEVYTIWGRPDMEEDPEEFSDYYARYGDTTLLYDKEREVKKLSFSISQEGFHSQWFQALGNPTEIKSDIEYYELVGSKQVLKIDKKNGYGYLITSEKKY